MSRQGAQHGSHHVGLVSHLGRRLNTNEWLVCRRSAE